MPLDKGIYFCVKYYLYNIYLLYGRVKLVSSIQVQQGAKITPVSFETGETLLSALRRAGYSIPAACGGKGRCGKCRVKVNGVPRPACKTRAQDGDQIDLPETMRGVILTDTLTLPKARTGRSGLGAAVDLGTTTVALRLFDRADGKLLALGLHEDLDEALRQSVAYSISLLSSLFHLPKKAIYLYLSAAADFDVSQAVDLVRGIHSRIPLSHFEGPAADDLIGYVMQAVEQAI